MQHIMHGTVTVLSWLGKHYLLSDTAAMPPVGGAGVEELKEQVSE